LFALIKPMTTSEKQIQAKLCRQAQIYNNHQRTDTKFHANGRRM
jgi:hypothetical protein